MVGSVLDELNYAAKRRDMAFEIELESWEYQKLRSAKMRALIQWNFTRDPDTKVVRFTHPQAKHLHRPQLDLEMMLLKQLAVHVGHRLRRVR